MHTITKNIITCLIKQIKNNLLTIINLNDRNVECEMIFRYITDHGPVNRIL